MSDKAFQDYYLDEMSHCYGCGRLNENGLQIKSYWDGDEAVCVYRPRAYHTAVPGYVYGGLIASLIDCHSTGTAAAAAFKAAGSVPGTESDYRFLTASLHVDYLKPTPIDGELTIRAQVKEIKGRKVVIACVLYAGDLAYAKGEVVAVQAPDEFVEKLLSRTNVD
ncbi:MAG: PaaI family thioesterase [Chloroflexi bacterium]|nr:MAG: PaaI family thioesterase [Chloroflexota bacterium]